ncbi:kinase-like domain-containing protein [Aspergillus unguis]
MAEATCILIREELRQAECPEEYYPRSAILEVFNSGDNLRQVYFCGCSFCRRDFRLGPDASFDNRRETFDPEELLTKYATIYALLICYNRPGLIRYFQEHRTYLTGAAFLTRENLHFLVQKKVERQKIIDDILKYQYFFQVRAIDRSREPVTLDPREVLPIRQDANHRGRGSFGQVWGFEFAYDEYRGNGMRHISRFVRKIFHDRSRDTVGLVEWFNVLHFDRMQHPHLMSALAAFWHGDTFSIIFEEAEQTLEAYLQSDGGTFSHEALWGQIEGLADGLAYLHGKAGTVIAYHGDLKPPNILIVKEVMKISDFGLLQVKNNMSGGPLAAWPSTEDIMASTRPYAGPSGNKASMDVWSFGAILSEIATFDLERKEGLEGYRQRRLHDQLESAPGHYTFGFHHDGYLKTTVAQQIDHLRELVHDSRSKKTNIHLPPFQQHFFRQHFFDLLRQMLSNGHVECPASEHVAEVLKELHQRAQSEHGLTNRGDIWDDVKDGILPTSPREPNCRLCVRLLEEPSSSPHARCGLLLHDRQGGRSLLIQCVLYNHLDVDLYILQEPFMRLNQSRPSFEPDYTDKPPRATLHQWDETKYKFEFNDVRDLLILQAAMIQQYAFNFCSFQLHSFRIPDRSFPLGPRRRSTVALEKVVVQLWSEIPLREEQTLWRHSVQNYEPRMHIAIISVGMGKLLLIKGTNPVVNWPDCS